MYAFMNWVIIGDNGMSPAWYAKSFEAEPMLTYCQLDHKKTYFNEILFEIEKFHSMKFI